jgi:HSP20 family protein
MAEDKDTRERERTRSATSERTSYQQNEQQRGNQQLRGEKQQSDQQQHGGAQVARRGNGGAMSPLGIASPFSLLRRFAEDMDRVLGEVGSGNSLEKAAWVPQIETEQRDGRLMVKVDLPGAEPEDIEVDIDDNTLVVSGERRQEQTERRGDVQIRERVYGRFYRAIPLPEGADTSRVEAQLKNGELDIEIPLREQQQHDRKHVDVRRG